MYIIITLICYTIVACIRRTRVPNEWLPAISGSLGAILGAGLLIVIPSIFENETVLSTAMYGLISGLAATGSNQAFKQTLRLLRDKHMKNREDK